MKKFLVLILIVFALIIWFLRPFFELEKIKDLQIKIIEIAEKEIFTPLPLRTSEKIENPEVILTQQGIINWTNIQRQEHNLPTLKENAKLNATAKAKIDDMFQYEYFAHESPSGQGVGDIVEKFNYEFLTIGENLAMGNFSSEKDLVEAWMNSPGHRENILNKTYQEIGIAVEKGIFNGKLVWLAVQHFGLPSTACPGPDETIKLKIDQEKQKIENFEKLLSKLLTEIKNIKPKWGSDYRQKVEEYNNLVEEYNKLLLENKKLIEEYNEQVQKFNQCLVDLK